MFHLDTSVWIDRRLNSFESPAHGSNIGCFFHFASLNFGHVLRDDESFSFGCAHSEGEFNLRDEVATKHLCQSLSPLSKDSWQIVSRSLQKPDRRGRQARKTPGSVGNYQWESLRLSVDIPQLYWLNQNGSANCLSKLNTRITE